MLQCGPPGSHGRVLVEQGEGSCSVLPFDWHRRKGGYGPVAPSVLDAPGAGFDQLHTGAHYLGVLGVVWTRPKNASW